MKKQQVIQTPDGTEVLKTKESRQKQRRWTFEANCEIIVAAHKNESGLDIPARKMPMRRMKLESVMYGTAKDARAECVKHEDYLRAVNPLFKDSIIQIIAIPHETVSNETLNQIQGYHDMSRILDQALELAIEEAGLLHAGHNDLSPNFTVVPEVPGTDDAPAQKGVSLGNLKEQFYKRALELLKPKEQEDGIRTSDNQQEQQEGNTDVPQVILTDAESSGEEADKPAFEPEIIHIERSNVQEVAS